MTKKPIYESYCAPISPEVIEELMIGCWHDMIPVKEMTEEERTKLGEVLKEYPPQEDFEFDKIIKEDLQEIWKVG